MPLSNTTIYCQNCRAANSLNESHCFECGTRLLLVIFPNSLQYDTNQVPSFYEDHLLERVSLLELRQVQLAEALRGAFEVIREQSQILREEKDLIKSLYKMFGFLKTEETEKIKKAWDELVQSKSVETAADNQKTQIIEKIISEHDLPNIELFSHLLKDSLRLFAENEEKQGFQMLERALLLSPRNVPLHQFFAEKLFFADKFEKADEILQKALQLAPENAKLHLLSGVIGADLSMPEKARRHLSLLINEESKLLVINFVWGMLAAFEENWPESIAAFKQSAQKNEIPELDYLIGCAYFQLKRYPMALRHFQKAVKKDENFADAWFMQSLIFKSQEDRKHESEVFEKALQANEPGAQCLEFLKGKKQSNPETALPFRHFNQNKSLLFSNGARRLLIYFRNEIRKALT